jgi:hypothetical protein
MKMAAWGRPQFTRIASAQSSTATPRNLCCMRPKLQFCHSRMGPSGVGVEVETLNLDWAIALNGQAPRRLPFSTPIKAIVVRRSCAYAVGTDSSAWIWGEGEFIRSRALPNRERTRPSRIDSETDWLMVSGSESHVLAIHTDGTLWGFGENGSGQLGDGANKSRISPTTNHLLDPMDFRGSRRGTLLRHHQTERPPGMGGKPVRRAWCRQHATPENPNRRSATRCLAEVSPQARPSLWHCERTAHSGAWGKR